ncbi:Methyl-accepting chemotaxis protein I serine chemoreceptor protein [Paraburkholderia caribensis MBA4]|uniref:Methyl-accepting chemotaxis protein I serine chemoreceptor protein n=1 Tax=Paraburkholderia caribensis MBA4 TaxID=1323664 RepID=A0A0P0RK94_9BURK|nr:methyl-accepting chemotaxis protein [Paraburkholderia caribensis]ALL68946.1 Methyl-accepting chemotaxis protein I serine chemoreceptor protein [Paraburkholderia caribensis MBA4]
MSELLASVKSRIILVLAIGIMINALVGGFGLRGMSSLSGSLHDTYTGNVVPITHIAKARAAMLNMRLLLWRMQAQQTKEHIQKVRDFSSQMQSEWKMYYPDGVTSDAERAIAEKLNTIIAQYDSAVAKELVMLESNDFAGAGAFQAQNVTPVGDRLSELLTQDFDVNANQGREADLAGTNLTTQLMWLSMALIVFGTVISIGSGVYLIRSITAPLNRTVRIASEIAEGRLDSRILVDVKGEFGRLLEAMKTMSDQLSSTVRGIRDSSESVTTAAGEIASGNLDLSARTEEQASSLEQTAASITELTETVRQNAENARQANSLASNAREMTNTGSASVNTMVQTINEISADSARIADITGMIEGVAFQTNILALNAAVEAARAGEQGRGFAVVAGEVRALAQRASAAAKEIKELIETSSVKVAQGARQASEVNDTMGRVIQAIGRVSDIVGEISAASDEQSKGIEQVRQAITQIDEVTQQNAALVEQSAAAAQSLQEQAERMKTDVMFFRLGADELPMRRDSGAPAALSSKAPARGVRTGGAPLKRSTSTTMRSTAKTSGAATATAPAGLPAPASGSSAGGNSDWEAF